jgi:rubrerythrin
MIQDAIEILASIRDAKYLPLFTENGFKIDYSRIRNMCDIAIDTLQKQIPKYPRKSQKYNTWICPECNCEVEDLDNYCSNCGQKLKKSY